MRAVFRSLAIGMLALGLTASPTAAQETGEIFGRVADTTGAVLPGVTVSVTSPALIQPKTAVTSATGSYRIPLLPIGTYTVRFNLDGFQTMVREGVVLRAGFNAEISPKLAISTLQETVTVSGESPVVDTSQVKTGENFTQEMLDSLPSARDPWVILQMTPGVLMDRQNVGGSASGQQSSFTAYGGNTGNTMWNVDGVTITDMAATGSSPMYYDFDSFAEIQIQTGGNDASQQTGGISLNIITKSGSNSFSGSGRVFFTDHALQSNNISDELYQSGAGSGNPIRNIKDYGFEMGGPLFKNKAWFWGGYGTQDIEVGIVGFRKQTPDCQRTFTGPEDEYNCLSPDITTLENYNAKLQYQPAVPHKLSFTFSRGDKQRNARGASATRPPETAWAQTGPTTVYKAQHQWVPSDRMTIDTAYAFTGGGFQLDLQDPSQYDTQILYNRNTGEYANSYFAYFYDRPQHEVKTDFNYFLSDVMGGDHSMKWGVRYRSTPSGAFSKTGGDVRADHRDGVSSRAILYRPYNVYSELKTTSAYFNDSFSKGRVRVNVGLRVDRQDDAEGATSVPENRIVPDLLPALSFQGVDSGLVYTDVSPRFGFTWDLFGTGKTVAKASGALYYGQGNYTSGFLNPLGTSYIIAPWNDANGDLTVQRSELQLAVNDLQGWSNWNPNDPAGFATLNDEIDPNLMNDRTREVIVGIDHELMRNFGVQVNYIYRNYDRFQYTPQLNQSTSDYIANTANVACGNAECGQANYDITYYTLPYRLSSDDRLTNEPFHRTNHSLELVARKRMTDRWMMNGSLVLQKTRGYYENGWIGDPTNLPFLDGHDDNSRNSRWVAKLMGMYSFPWQINVSGFLNARDGYPRAIQILSPNRSNGLGAIAVYTEPYATTRYDPLVLLDLRAEKWFDIGPTRLAASMDIFNAFNSGLVLDRENRLDRSSFNRIEEVVVARVLRFGVRMTF